MSENMKELYNRTLVCFVWVRNLVSHTERHTLSLFENRVPRRIFGPTLVEVTGDWSRLYTEDHSIFFMFTQCYSGDKIRNEMVGALTRIWEGGGVARRVRTEFWWGNLRHRDHLVDTGAG